MRKITLIIGAITFSVIISFVIFSYLKGSKFIEPILVEGIDKDIILINIGNGDRAYIGNIINKVNQYKPKVIGLDIIFQRRNYYKGDTILSDAIKNAPIVLASEGNTNSRSDKFFSGFAKYNSSIGVILDDNIVHKFHPIKNFNNTIIEHFGITVAKKYDSLNSLKYTSKIENDKEYFIEYTKLGKDFLTYKYKETNFDSLKIKDKIVLLGYLGPSGEDKFNTPMKFTSFDKIRKGKDTYGVVILANIIRMVLHHDENEKVE